MKFTLFGLASVALLFVSLFPGSAAAYGTSAQIAHRLDDTHTLYIISYDFGFLNRVTDLPIMALRDTLSDNKAAVLYDLIDADGQAGTLGTTYGLVVSDRPIADNRYHLDKGKAGKFNLVVIHEHAARTISPLALKINHLPMTLTNDDGQEKAFTLSEAELAEYVTPAVK